LACLIISFEKKKRERCVIENAVILSASQEWMRIVVVSAVAGQATRLALSLLILLEFFVCLFSGGYAKSAVLNIET
jgi:hypothetical protein